MAETPQITPLRCGTIRTKAELMAEGEAGEIVLPVYAFLITHPKHRPVVFDAGLAPSDHGRVVGGAFHNDLPDGHDLASRVRAAGVDPAQVQAVVLSHAHYDHAGGLGLLPNARLVMHRDEDPREVQVTTDALRTGESHDIFGDGSVEVFATPGHTRGHQSLRVRRFGGYDVLAGDACYFCRSLARDEAEQPYAFDKPLYLASKRRLAQMQADGDFVVPGHDERFLDQIPDGSAIRAGPLSRL